jgi:hypothetical protein
MKSLCQSSFSGFHSVSSVHPWPTAVRSWAPRGYRASMPRSRCKAKGVTRPQSPLELAHSLLLPLASPFLSSARHRTTASFTERSSASTVPTFLNCSRAQVHGALLYFAAFFP